MCQVLYYRNKSSRKLKKEKSTRGDIYKQRLQYITKSTTEVLQDSMGITYLDIKRCEFSEYMLKYIKY